MRVRNPFRSNSLPQLRTPARNTPDAPRSAPNSPIQPQAPRPPPPKMQLRGNEHPLSQHIGQKAQEQKILDQWNSNAQGRNQGLVHLVDYSYARPPKINTTPPKQGLTPEQMNILKQGDKNGWNEQQWKAKLGDKTFNDLNKQGYFSNFAGANGVPVGANAQKWQQLTGQHQALSGQLGQAQAQLTAERKAYTAQLKQEGVTGKEMGARLKQWEATNPTKQQADSLKSQLDGVQGQMDAQRRYTLASDVSKQGRLAQIEQSAGLPLGSLKGNEIIGGTNAVQNHLSGHPLNPNAISPNKPLDMYVKQPNGNWSLQTVQPQDLAQTYSGKQTVDGLTVAKWGLSPEALRLSTVMGGGKTE